ncbi:MAG: hypothetical protein HC804_00450 [Anaerolineae bacterium]|nr:hypothetical protein [Anaerolineae bacterium]
MTFALVTTVLSETPSSSATPIGVVLMIVLLVLVLFAWGVINSSGAWGSPNSAADGHDTTHDAHNDHH